MAGHPSVDALRLAFAARCRASVETVLERPLSAGDGAPATGDGWSTPIAVTGSHRGSLAVWFDVTGANALARAMLGIDEVPEPSVAADMLRQVWSQAAAALSADLPGLALVVGLPTPAPAPAAPGVPWNDGTGVFGTLAIAGELAAQAAGRAEALVPGYPGNLASILEIDLPLVARFARTEMPLRAVAQLGPGSMVDMGRAPDAPVQLLVGGQVIAEGEVVVVRGNYGVRITSLVSPADRLKAIQL